MRTGWVAGFVMFYFLLLACEMMIGGWGAFSSAGQQICSAILSPELTNYTGATTVFSTVFTNTLTFVFSLLSMFFLYSPLVFNGIWLWAYVPVLAIVITMFVNVFTIMRGVHSS